MAVMNPNRGSTSIAPGDSRGGQCTTIQNPEGVQQGIDRDVKELLLLI